MKSLFLLPVAIFLMAISPTLIMGQEAEKEVKIKVVKEKDGEHTVLDTTFTVSGEGDDIDMDELKAILEEEGIEDMDFDFDFDSDDEVRVKVIKLDGEAGENENVMVVKSVNGDEDEEGYSFTVKSSGSSSAESHIHVSVDGDENVFISEDGEVHKIKMGDDNEKVIIMKHSDGEDIDLMYGHETNVWIGDDHDLVEIIEDENGKKVIVKNEDGTTKEYFMEDGKGTYFIGEDGEMKKVDSDMEWVDDNSNGVHKVNVKVDDGNEMIVITKNGKTIELKDFDEGNNAFVYATDDDSGEHEVFIEVIEKKEGDETIIVKSKVIVKSISDEDVKSMEKSGVKLEEDNAEKLEVENLVFHPNPSDGKFRLEFTAPEKTTTEIVIYDMQGKTVYDERITNFKGTYSKEIDISSESKGTYFLNISQGNKMSSRKIILD